MSAIPSMGITASQTPVERQPVTWTQSERKNQEWFFLVLSLALTIASTCSTKLVPAPSRITRNVSARSSSFSFSTISCRSQRNCRTCSATSLIWPNTSTLRTRSKGRWPSSKPRDTASSNSRCAACTSSTSALISMLLTVAILPQGIFGIRGP